MLPLVVGPALQELGGFTRGTPEFTHWFGLLFYVPAVCGGIFGLLGGYLTDRFGRRRVLTWSILLYAFSAFLAGFSTNLWMLLILAHDDVHRRVRGVRRGRRLAGRVVRRSQAARKGAWATRRRFRRSAACWWPSVNGLIARYAAQAAGDRHARIFCNPSSAPIAEPACTVAIHADERADPRDSADRHSAVLAGVAEVGGEESGRHAAAAEYRRAVSPAISPHDDRHHDHVRVQLWRGVRRDPAVAADRARHSIRCGQKVAEATEGKPAAEATAIAGRTTQEIVANYTKAQELGGLFGRFALALLVVHIASRRNCCGCF